MYIRIKLDTNNLMRQIEDYLSCTRNEANETAVIGIAMGLELLQNYLRKIAERSIALDDDELISLLLDLGILKTTEAKECNHMRKVCPLRHENGNCLPCGGTCPAVNESLCEALNQAYEMGKRKGGKDFEQYQKNSL